MKRTSIALFAASLGLFLLSLANLSPTMSQDRQHRDIDNFIPDEPPIVLMDTDDDDEGVTQVEVTNFPLQQEVFGTVSVDNFPAQQQVTGTVDVGNLPVDENGAVIVTVRRQRKWEFRAFLEVSTSGSRHCVSFSLPESIPGAIAGAPGWPPACHNTRHPA